MKTIQDRCFVQGMPRQHLAVHVFAGLVGGLAGSFAMERFQRALGKLSPDLGGAPGGGGQQYRKPQSEPATYVAADRVACLATGEGIAQRDKPLAGSLVHYAFGGGLGAIYGAVAAHRPQVATGAGVPFGIAVWVTADEIGVPALGLAKPPTAYPFMDHASGFASHLIYGGATEAVRRLLVRALRPRGQPS